jgi:hypothetical protein
MSSNVMGNLANRLSPLAVGLLVFPLMLSAVFAQALRDDSHPDENVFQYRVKNYVVQRPWDSYPTGREAEQWECFDDATKAAVNCFAAGGAMERFRHIYKQLARTMRPPDGPAARGTEF